MDRKLDKARGYELRYHVDGDRWTQKGHAYGVNGELPGEWGELTQQPEVKDAVIFPSTQRGWRPEKRRLADKYARDGQEG